MAKAIGVDLGTTNSCVAVMEGNKAKVIEAGHAPQNDLARLCVAITTHHDQRSRISAT